MPTTSQKHHPMSCPRPPKPVRWPVPKRSGGRDHGSHAASVTPAPSREASRQSLTNRSSRLPHSSPHEKSERNHPSHKPDDSQGDENAVPEHPPVSHCAPLPCPPSCPRADSDPPPNGQLERPESLRTAATPPHAPRHPPRSPPQTPPISPGLARTRPTIPRENFIPAARARHRNFFGLTRRGNRSGRRPAASPLASLLP